VEYITYVFYSWDTHFDKNGRFPNFAKSQKRILIFATNWDQWYEFSNIFAKKLAFFAQNTARFCKI
jgi:hypothetical protein